MCCLLMQANTLISDVQTDGEIDRGEVTPRGQPAYKRHRKVFNQEVTDISPHLHAHTRKQDVTSAFIILSFISLQ